jgi:hypothetical protein
MRASAWAERDAPLFSPLAAAADGLAARCCSLSRSAAPVVAAAAQIRSAPRAHQSHTPVATCAKPQKRASRSRRADVRKKLKLTSHTHTRTRTQATEIKLNRKRKLERERKRKRKHKLVKRTDARELDDSDRADRLISLAAGLAALSLGRSSAPQSLGLALPHSPAVRQLAVSRRALVVLFATAAGPDSFRAQLASHHRRLRSSRDCVPSAGRQSGCPLRWCVCLRRRLGGQRERLLSSSSRRRPSSSVRPRSGRNANRPRHSSAASSARLAPAANQQSCLTLVLAR